MAEEVATEKLMPMFKSDNMPINPYRVAWEINEFLSEDTIYIGDGGDVVVAGIPGDEATVKTYRPDGAEVVLIPANPTMEPMRFAADEVSIYGRVVTVMRRL